MTAFVLTLQALHLIHQLDSTSMAQARTLLDQAITYDPDYAPAYSHMASLQMKWILQGWSEDEMTDRKLAARPENSVIPDLMDHRQHCDPGPS